ncbi:Inhibitor of growth protein 5 [Rhizophlyctis rosea]|nr:Inhibitor of growth protein 5 [Rhizophlyctis rosea]
MALVYLEDYLDTVESLPAELSRNFTLMKELEAMAEGINTRLREIVQRHFHTRSTNTSHYTTDSVKKVEQDISDFMSDLRKLEPKEQVAMLEKISNLFKETLKHGEDKVALAIQTYDMVDRHIRRLDDDLNKFEDEQMTGPRFLSAATGMAREELRTGTQQKAKEASRGEKRPAAAAQVVDTPTKKRKTKHSVDDKVREATPVNATPKRPTNGKNTTTDKNKTTKKEGQKKVYVLWALLVLLHRLAEFN